MKRFVLLMSLCVATAMGQTPSKERHKPVDKGPAIDQQAIAVLTRMNEFLGTLKTFSLTSESSKDEIVDTDMKIQKNATNEILVQMPDRLFAHLRGDDHNVQLIYSGQTLTLFSIKDNYYAASPAPPTVARTLDAIRAKHGIVFPLADFIQVISGENILQDMTRAGYIGTSGVSGTDCDHIAVRQPDVDWQVWIEKSATPVPRKLVITSKTQPTQPQYEATLTWNLAPRIDDALFTFTPPSNAVRIKFARMKSGQPNTTNPR